MAVCRILGTDRGKLEGGAAPVDLRSDDEVRLRMGSAEATVSPWPRGDLKSAVVVVGSAIRSVFKRGTDDEDRAAVRAAAADGRLPDELSSIADAMVWPSLESSSAEGIFNSRLTSADPRRAFDVGFVAGAALG